ncbi:MAG: leucine-rich repeat domain-containing protein, partial [Xenococcus sp. (in: cyanobacteria)]
MSEDTIPEDVLRKIKGAKRRQVTKLNLSSSNLTKIPEEVFKLTHIRVLDLSDNKINELPESIGNLSNLTELSLSDNQLKNLPKSIGNLSNLTQLDLSNNQLKNLPEFIGDLSNLTRLNLSKNQLKILPKSIGNLSNLTWLNLNNNNLVKLPESIGNLSRLIWLHLENNPLETPPIEVANKSINAIKEYFQQLNQVGEDYLYEAKLLIVGEPAAGKTSLAKKIQDPKYKLQANEACTEGIDVINWSFPILDKEQKTREFKVNIWDFGGNVIYYATHKFFLTQRSLYILVADSRKEDTDFYYWLNIVELLSNNSPLLIIKNEKQDHTIDINERALRGQFSNLRKTLATNLANNRGLEEILTDIKHYIQTLPHIGQTLPKTWVKVRQVLKNYSHNRNYISLQEYLDICEDNGIIQLEDKLQLSGYLHDLG